jgi:hypothetical protein
MNTGIVVSRLNLKSVLKIIKEKTKKAQLYRITNVMLFSVVSEP